MLQTDRARIKHPNTYRVRSQKKRYLNLRRLYGEKNGI